MCIRDRFSGDYAWLSLGIQRWKGKRIGPTFMIGYLRIVSMIKMLLFDCGQSAFVSLRMEKTRVGKNKSKKSNNKIEKGVFFLLKHGFNYSQEQKQKKNDKIRSNEIQALSF
eukprot:TRINITY_DN4840_c0_g1_i1.p2 TRINITY_DN4840_c0_g1~~TRINITY_DN4840_c0_g1_i1.p2  ORF type:complete len:112 (-),score=14.26 TRINITY_DN4840_c0_g1_i1:304-639(-)